jgi:ATP-dependent RNA helicase HelY
VVETLDRNALLPAIVFIFSRAGCEGAVDQVRSSGIQLTTQDERAQIEEIVDMRCAGLPPEDLGALGYLHWRDHLAAGIAAHHAGMIPLFKEVVEELFKQGLVKVVYATETLALGINMPARSVVLEKLVKWDGQGHKDLTAGEYTQLTGRAGRRGIDVEGHAVVVEHPGFDSTQLARLASRRTYPLISSFQPSYNMTVNLVASSGVYRARELLELSFAQFQADQGVVGKAARVRELEREIAGFGQAVECDKGDFLEYAALRERIGRTEKRAASTSAQRRRESTASTLANLRQGDVIRIGSGKRAGIAVVVAPDNHRESPRPVVVSEAGRSFRVAVADLHRGVDKVGEVKLPRKADFRNAQSRREIALALQRAAHEFSTSREAQVTQGGSSSRETEALRRQLRAHPCHGCPDRENHARWAERYFQALRKRDAMVGEISKATGSIARIFERRCGVLTDLGYLEGEGDELTVTEAGQSMRGLYAENDLVVTECMRTGAWAGLNGPGLAAVCSAVLYQGRREDETRSPKMPGGNHGPIAQAIDNTVRVWSELDDLHAERGLPALPAPHPGLVGAIHGWAQGRSLDQVLDGTQIAPGDMVRWCKQTIDLLEQIELVSTDAQLAERARSAITAMRRGVVAY